MLKYQEWVPKFVAALRQAEADGVEQIAGWLGRPDGCRCAEGVVADVLVAEGVLASRANTKLDLVEYRIDKLGYRYEASALGKILFVLFGRELLVPYTKLGHLQHTSLWRLNDNMRLTLGQIADVLEYAYKNGEFDG